MAVKNKNIKSNRKLIKSYGGFDEQNDCMVGLEIFIDYDRLFEEFDESEVNRVTDDFEKFVENWFSNKIGHNPIEEFHDDFGYNVTYWVPKDEIKNDMDLFSWDEERNDDGDSWYYMNLNGSDLSFFGFGNDYKNKELVNEVFLGASINVIVYDMNLIGSSKKSIKSGNWKTDYKSYLPGKFEENIELYWKETDPEVRKALKKAIKKQREWGAKRDFEYEEEIESACCGKKKAKKIKSGYSNNPDYFGDWYGEGQIDFSEIINPEDDGNVWMVKLWSGSGYVLDVYLCKANNVYEAIDRVLDWSYENEGANNLVFDYDHVYDNAKYFFDNDPDLFGEELSWEDFEDRYIEETYISNKDFDKFAYDENFFVAEVPEEYLTNSKKLNSGCHGKNKKDKNMRKTVKSGRFLKSAESYGWVVESSEAWEAYDMACDYLGKEEVNQAIVDSMSTDELAESLAFLFRQWDFTEWDERNGEIESARKVVKNSITLRDLKNYARDGVATDITTWDSDKIKELGHLEKVQLSRGTYGMNGGLFKDDSGNLYVVTARNANLFGLA